MSNTPSRHPGGAEFVTGLAPHHVAHHHLSHAPASEELRRPLADLCMSRAPRLALFRSHRHTSPLLSASSCPPSHRQASVDTGPRWRRARAALATLVAAGSAIALSASASAQLPDEVGEQVPADVQNESFSRLAFRTYTPSDGYPATETRHMTSDVDGFMWFATIGGLTRFDGHTFRRFQADPQDPNAMPQFAVHSVTSDPEQGVWAAAGTLVHVDAVSDTITRTDIVADYVERADKLIWMWSAPNTVMLFDPATKEIVMEAEAPTVITPGSSKDVGALSDELAVLGDAQGLWTVTDTGEFTLYPMEGMVDNPDVLVDDAGLVWTLDNESLYRFDPDSGEIDKVANRSEAYEPGTEVPPFGGAFVERGDGTIWIGTAMGGVEIYDPTSDEIRNLPPNGSLSGLGGKSVSAGFRDHQGGLWLATFGTGVSYLPPGLPAVWQQPIPATEPGVDPFDVFLDMELVGDTLYVGSDGGGLQPFDLKTETYGAAITTENSDLPSDSVIGMARSGDELWLGMWGGPMTRYNTVTGEFRPLLSVEDGGPVVGNNVFDIVAGPDGTMWASIWDVGVQVFDAEGNSLAVYGPHGDIDGDGTIDVDIDIEIENMDAIDIVPDHDGAAWVAGWLGVERIDTATGTVTRWSAADGDLLGDIVFDLHFDDDNTVWIATSAGLEHLDPATGEVERFGPLEGVPGPAVIQIAPQADGQHLWLATSDRLAEFDTDTKTVTVTYGREDNLPEGGFARFGNVELANDIHVFSTNNGLAFARPIDLVGWEPPAYVEATDIDGKNIGIDDSTANESIRFGSGGIRLTFKYTAVDYQHPNGLTYEHRLVGVTDEWSYADHERTATYTELAPGTYTFEVRARSASGMYSSEPAQLTVVVVPRWWETSAARVGAVIAVVALLLAGILAYVIRSRRRQRELEKLVAERTAELEVRTNEAVEANAAKTRFLSSVSHELRNPLQSVIGYAELISMWAPNDDLRHWSNQIYTSGSDLLSMIEELLELSALKSSPPILDVVPVNLADLASSLAEAIDNAPGTKQNVRAHIDVTHPNVLCDARRLRQVIANLTTNAVKYSTGESIDITVTELGAEESLDDSVSQYRIAVRDEGPGMAPEQVAKMFEPFVRGQDAAGAGAGLGLAISTQLVQRFGGNLDVVTKLGEGTEFFFVIELSRADPVGTDSGTDSGDVADAGHHINSLAGAGTVLLVESEGPSRQALVDALMLLGVSVKAVSTGTSALEVARQLEIDTLVVGDGVVDIDAVDLVAEVRRLSGDRVPVIAVTSQDDGGELYADEVLRKPATLAALSTALRAAHNLDRTATIDATSTASTTEVESVSQI